jgi:hypothetical protein
MKNALANAVWTGIGILALVACSSSTPKPANVAAAGSGEPAPEKAAATGALSCKTADSCWMVTSPAGYDVKGDCEAVKGTVQSSACNKADYKRKCTQESEAKEDGKVTKVTWVYYFAAGNDTACTGTDEKL